MAARLFTRTQTIYFTPIEITYNNPLTGWAPWANNDDCEQPHSLVYADLSWRDFEPEEGTYDFDSFENNNQLAKWRAEGKRIVFRFVLDYPREESHIDIPDWLFEKIDGQGDFYSNGYGNGFSPDYANPILIEYHQKAIQKLGEKYANDGYFAYIELGSLGHWGEWHVNKSSGIRPLPNENIRDIYVSHYLESFPKTHLLMRRPFTIAKDQQLGLYNDMSGDFDATQTWLNWIAYGDEYEQTGEANGLVPMPDGWKLAPIGGEQSPDLSNHFLYQDDLERTVALFTQSHTTFIGPNTPCKEPLDGDLQPGLDRITNTIGHKLTITEARIPYWIAPGSNAKVNITLSNLGIAPIYYNWPLRLYMFNYNSQLVYTSNFDADIRTILPGINQSFTALLSPRDFPPGIYSLGAAIVDPETGNPAIHLSMEDQISELVFTLGTVEVKAGWTGVFNTFIDY